MAYSTFIEFRKFVQNVVEKNDLSNFKQEPVFTFICEHKNCRWGNEFYNLIKTEFALSDDEIMAFCKINDRLGNPDLRTYSCGVCASNSLKYVYHANLALKHIQTNGNSANVVEIGGGYGGMALAMNFFAPRYGITISSYKLIDFPELIKLQELYLKNILGDISKFQFHSAFDYGSDIHETNLYLLAMYSLGELSVDDKQRYIDSFLPKTSHGFLIWNALPYVNLKKDEILTDEIPLTGPYNKFIYY